MSLNSSSIGSGISKSQGSVNQRGKYLRVDRTHRKFGWLLVSRTGGIRTGLVVIDDIRVIDGKIVPASEIMFRMRSGIFLKLHP